MPGHDTVANLGHDQTGTGFEGKFLLVKSGVPGSGDTGFGKGALGVNTAGSDKDTTWYVNLGTAGSPTWTSLEIA